MSLSSPHPVELPTRTFRTPLIDPRPLSRAISLRHGLVVPASTVSTGPSRVGTTAVMGLATIHEPRPAVCNTVQKRPTSLPGQSGFIGASRAAMLVA